MKAVRCIQDLPKEVVTCKWTLIGTYQNRALICHVASYEWLAVLDCRTVWNADIRKSFASSLRVQQS